MSEPNYYDVTLCYPDLPERENIIRHRRVPAKTLYRAVTKVIKESKYRISSQGRQITRINLQATLVT